MKSKMVFVPSVTNKPIVAEVVRTFGRDVPINLVHLTSVVVNNYASEELIEKLVADIEGNIISWVSTHADSEIYVVLTGGILQALIAVRALDKLGVDYKFLVYEKKLRKYVVLDKNGHLI